MSVSAEELEHMRRQWAIEQFDPLPLLAPRPRLLEPGRHSGEDLTNENFREIWTPREWYEPIADEA